MEGLEHPNITRLVLDVTNAEHIEDVVSTVITTEGKIDILINNAGATLPGTTHPHYGRCLLTMHLYIGPLMDMTVDQARRAFETNTIAPFALCRAVVPHMARRTRGVVVNISSVMGEM